MNRNTHVLIISETQQGRAGGVLLDFEVVEKTALMPRQMHADAHLWSL